MTTIPQYLIEPKSNGLATFGQLKFSNGEYVIVNAAPQVREMVKRVFPGAGGRGASDLRFQATRRLVGELNWLMLRYPLEFQGDAKKRFAADRKKAIDHAIRRENNQALQATAAPPTFHGTLLPYQGEGVAYLIANERTLLADEMGLGKTITALAAAAQIQAFPVIIVVPASVQRQWRKQVGMFLRLPVDGELLPDLDGSKSVTICKGLTPYKLPKTPIYVCHYGLLNAWLKTLQALEPKAVIFDEAQELRRSGSYKYSAASLLAGSVDFVWGLSGTPIYNYGSEIWYVLNILDYHCMGDHDSFTREWCAGYGEKIVDKVEALNSHLKAEGLMLRRLKADVQAQLPPKRRIVTAINKDDDVYAKLIAKAVNMAKSADVTQMTYQERGKLAIDLDQESRYATGMSKARHVADFILSLLEAGEKVLSYAWHHDVHDIIIEALEKAGKNPVRITGQETQNQRVKALEAFQNGETDVVQLSLRTTAGLDGLQGRGTCVVFGELDWAPAVHAQCEDRLHRIGVTADSLLCYYLVSDAGHDEVMQEALGLKISQFVGIMGDKPETADERVVAAQVAKEHLEKVIDRLKRERVKC